MHCKPSCSYTNERCNDSDAAAVVTAIATTTTTASGAGWLCGTMLGLWHEDYELNPGSRQLLGERGSALSLTLT